MNNSTSVEKQTDIPTPGLYRHFKGNLYEVLGVAYHSETEEVMVLYRPCYGKRALWVRPLNIFNASAQMEGRRVVRFTRCD